jgi:aryl-alcohol dehydrogenase-like predicted oxidoreductase
LSGRLWRLQGAATKRYWPLKSLEWVDRNVYRNSTPERIREEIEDSLRRLRTDRIDLYQVHWPDPLVPIEDVAETLLELKREGKILALGVSNYSPEQMEAWSRWLCKYFQSAPPTNHSGFVSDEG